MYVIPEMIERTKRLVTPDVLHLGEFGGRQLLEFYHNPSFSEVTMYENPNIHLRSIVEDRQKGGEITPRFILQGHQHVLHMIYEGQTWLGSLPGLTDPKLVAQGQLSLAHTRVLTDKMHRRLTFGKEMVRPGILEIDAFKDGRTIFTFWNPEFLEITQANQDKPKFHEMIAILGDVQNGSISHRPEIVWRFLDYVLQRAKQISQEKGVRVRLTVVINGDFNHGNVYAAHMSENHLTKLGTLRSQKDFGFNQLYPYLVDPEFLYYLVALHILTGNHEWDPPIVQARGQNDLDYLYFGFNPLLYQMFKYGKGKLDHRIPVYLNGRWRNMAMHDGDITNWPFTEVNAGGFKLGFMHKFYMKSGKVKDPTVILKNWVKTAGKMAAPLHAIYQNHLHHREFRMHGTMLLNQDAAYAGISGYEWNQGFHSTVMGQIVHISQDGFQQEEVPFEFMRNWKCGGPFKEVDERGFLDPPPVVSAEYRSGERSQYTEWLCQYIHQYPPFLSETEVPTMPFHDINPVEQFLKEKRIKTGRKK